MKLSASTAEVSDDGYRTLVAFADSIGHSVILSAQNEPESQDLETGTSGVHIEAGEEAEGYDLVRSVRLEDNVLILELQTEEIRIDLSAAPLDRSSLETAVHFFRQRLAEVTR